MKKTYLFLFLGLKVMRASVDVIVVGGNDKFERPEACVWIDGKMTTVFHVIKVINSVVENKGDCTRKFLI